MPKYSLVELYLDAVRTQYFKNDPEGALKKLERLQQDMEETRSGDSELLFRVPARINVLKEQFAKASSQAEAGLLFFSNDPELILLRAIPEIYEGNQQQAFALIDQALEKIGQDDAESKAIAFLLRGDNWGKQREFDAQIEEYKTALEHFPKFPLAYDLIGHVLLEEGKFSPAKEAFKKAISFNVPMPWSELGIAIADKNLGDLRAAISGFYKVIENFDNPTLQYRAARNLASCFYRKKEYDKARKQYVKALKLEPRDVPTLCDLTVVCMEADELSDSSGFLALALKHARAANPQAKGTINKGIAILKSLVTIDELRKFMSDFTVTNSPIVHALAYLLCGIVFESQMKFGDAKLLYDRVIQTTAEPVLVSEAKRRIDNLSEVLIGMYKPTTSNKGSQRKEAVEKPNYVNFSRYRRASIRR